MKVRKWSGILLIVLGIAGSLTLSGLRIYESYYKWIINDSGMADKMSSFTEYFLTYYIRDFVAYFLLGLILSVLGSLLYRKK
jgi:hypothetical protein